MDTSWKELLSFEFSSPYFTQLADAVRFERAESTVFPPPGDVFTAFTVTPYDNANVVLLGQDPYHNAGQAHGLAFSVRPGVKPPPSLANIYRELQEDLGHPPVSHGYLLSWAQQGVFLLNSVLTVRAHEPGSHRDLGWETFTDSVLRALNRREKPVVFVLWGRYAREKRGLIDVNRHVVLESAHPSPMSAHQGFFGSRPFSKINQALRDFGHTEIDWKLPDQVPQ